MKKLLLSFVSAFLIFTLSAQVADNFSDYTAGGKIAQQAQAMGRNYWTTWSGTVGAAEDAVIADQSGNKVLNMAFGNDQVLLLGEKTSGVWTHSFKIFIPTGKDGYFNILANYPASDNSDWAFQVGFAYDTNDNNSPYYPGIAKIYAGASECINVNFAHDTWIDVLIKIDLDDDHAELSFNGTLVHQWTYSSGSFGSGCSRIIDAFNIYPPSSTSLSNYYIDDIAFSSESGEIIFSTAFDELPNNSYLAQSYPQFWETWGEAPGTNEDALITTEQAASAPHSAKCAYGTDLVFLAGNKTSGIYTLDFDMYFPNNGRGYFNLLHDFNRGNGGQDSEWAIGVYFNVSASGMPAGTNVQQNGILTPFTFPYATWFPVNFYINLDDDIATLKINGTQVLEWQYSLIESGGAGLLQLAAADFFPPQAGSTFFIDNFKFASKSSGPTFPVIGVTPTTFFEKLPDGGTAQKTISITNSGTAIGNYYSWIEYDVVPATGSGNYTLQYCGEPYTSVGYSTYVGPIEVGVKFKADQLSNKLGAKITKMSYFVPQNASLNSLIFRIYAPFSNNKPGELLKEFKKTSDIMTGDWNEITFPEPLLIDRSEFWFTVEFQQTSGAYPMSFDEIENFPVMPETNYVRQGTGSWSEFSSWGNFCITGAAQGGVIPCYLPLSGATYGTISKGTTKTINATFGASGLADGVYKATIFVPTSDENNPMFEIPCTLVKGKIAYMSVTPTSISETVSVGEDNAITVPVPITNRGTAEGTYSAAPAPADAWLSLTGDAQGTVAIDGSKTFNAVIDPTGLEKGDYEAAILVTTNDPSNGLITIACKLKVEGQGIETYINGVHTTLFPNPATDLVNVTCNKTINTIQVINYNGQIVYSAPVNDDKTTINTSNLSAGYYFVRVITDESAHSVKLIVK